VVYQLCNSRVIVTLWEFCSSITPQIEGMPGKRFQKSSIHIVYLFFGRDEGERGAKEWVPQTLSQTLSGAADPHTR
jgi:hypothetical protein